jgi:hypothetical protein
MSVKSPMFWTTTHTRLVSSEQKPSDHTFPVVNFVDLDTSATIAQIQVL